MLVTPLGIEQEEKPELSLLVTSWRSVALVRMRVPAEPVYLVMVIVPLLVV